MRQYLEELLSWQNAGLEIASATVISTWGSSPRPSGSQMFINEQGDILGSVSGGCVEGAVAEAALETLKDGRARRLDFGVADETAWEVGLACGGEIGVLVKNMAPEYLQAWAEDLEPEEHGISVMLLTGTDQQVGQELLLNSGGLELWSGDLPEDLIRRMKAAAERFASEPDSSASVIAAALAADGDEVFFLRMERKPLTLIAVGGVHIAVPLIQMASVLEFRTVVIDPRKMFGSAARFPQADRLLQMWPQPAFEEVPIDSRTAVAALTHDPKIDDPALEHALRSEAFYIGALGSTRTQHDRRERLADRGFTPEQLERIHGPIGLDLGGRSAGEIALSILAEVISVLY